MRRALSLPVYRRLLVAYGLNELCWSVGTLALTVLVYRRTQTALGAASFFIVSMVLPALLSPALVVRLERLALARLLPALYVVEALLFGVLAWMAAGHFLLVPVLGLALADGAVAAAARSFARAASTAVLVPADLLHEGNALTNGVFSVTYMCGPAVGGLVVAAGGTAVALLVNCGLFATMSAVLIGIGLAGPAPEAEEQFGRRLRAAVEHVRARPGLQVLLYLQAIGFVFFTIATPVEVVLAERTLHAGATGYGLLLSAWGAGAVGGSLAYARWRRLSARALLTAGAGAVAAGYLVLALAPNLGVALAGAALGGASNGIEVVAARTALQEQTEQRWMAMIMSLFDSVSQLAPGVGILIGGAVAQFGGPRPAFGVAAAGAVVFMGAVWVMLAPRRQAAWEAPGDPVRANQPGLSEKEPATGRGAREDPSPGGAAQMAPGTKPDRALR